MDLGGKDDERQVQRVIPSWKKVREKNVKTSYPQNGEKIVEMLKLVKYDYGSLLLHHHKLLAI